MKPRVLVTPRSLTARPNRALARMSKAGFEVVLGPAGRQPAPAELRALLPDCVGYLAGVERVDAETLSCATALRVIARNGAGTDNIDRDAAGALGIVVRNTPGVNAQSVAELTLALMLALARDIPASDVAMRAGRWQRGRGIELHGRSLGVVGFGQIGRLVARFGVALGMTTRAYDPFLDAHAAGRLGVEPAAMDVLLRASDVVTLHCPPRADGRPLIDAPALQAMKPGALLVNTARWALMDAEAVLAALDAGTIGGLALDAYDTEPPAPSEPLVHHRNTVCTPHLGAFTEASSTRAAEAAVDQLLAVLSEPSAVSAKGAQR